MCPSESDAESVLGIKKYSTESCDWQVNAIVTDAEQPLLELPQRRARSHQTELCNQNEHIVFTEVKLWTS